jgi:hypothetical protein
MMCGKFVLLEVLIFFEWSLYNFQYPIESFAHLLQTQIYCWKGNRNTVIKLHEGTY